MFQTGHSAHLNPLETNHVGLDAASSLSIVHSLKKLTQLGLTSVPWPRKFLAGGL